MHRKHSQGAYYRLTTVLSIGKAKASWIPHPASRRKFLILSRHVVMILHDFAPAHRHIIILSQLMDHFHGYVVVKMACKVFLLNISCTISCNTLITPRVAVLSRIQPLSQGRLCSSLKKVTWLQLVTCLLDYYRFHYVNWREDRKVKFLSPLNSSVKI